MLLRNAKKVAAAIGLLSFTTFCAAAQKPKLVVGIVVDQFRYDYLTRFRGDYHGGFDQLLTKGADFTNAFYGQIPTVTAVGHSIFMSGAMPSVSGIVSNAWYDRESGEVVTSVCDWKEKLVGADTMEKEKKCTDYDPASPRRLMVSTVGDELVDANPESRVVGVSLKPRAAILPSGHRAKGAFWFDDEDGSFVTSSFYMGQLPDWAVAFNAQKLPDQYVKAKWEGFPKWTFTNAKWPKYGKLPASPWGNELIEKFAEQAIAGEKLGQHSATDLLTVSFSSNDYVGHAVGPDAPEVRDMAKRTDELIGKLLKVIDERVGLRNTIVVLTADHGVAATPAHDEASRLPGGYMTGDLAAAVEKALQNRFGEGPWLVPGAGDTSLYLDWKTVAKAKAPVDEVYRVAREALMIDPQLHVARVYTREQLENGLSGDFIASAAENGFNPKRSGDLLIVLDPNYLYGGAPGTTHFSPYAYDRHVPVLFMGPGIKPGRYNETIQPNDIAPTLATMLDVQTPSGSSGRVLVEMLEH